MRFESRTGLDTPHLIIEPCRLREQRLTWSETVVSADALNRINTTSLLFASHSSHNINCHSQLSRIVVKQISLWQFWTENAATNQPGGSYTSRLPGIVCCCFMFQTWWCFHVLASLPATSPMAGALIAQSLQDAGDRSSCRCQVF